jgi:hypothetical protein
LDEQQNVVHEDVAMLLGGFQKSQGQANAPSLDSNVWTAIDVWTAIADSARKGRLGSIGGNTGTALPFPLWRL